MKKVLSVIIILSILFGCTAQYIYAYDEYGLTTEEIYKAKSNLISAGWTEEEIEDLMDEKALADFVDIEKVVSSEKKYYKVTENSIVQISELQCFSDIACINNENISSEETTLQPPSDSVTYNPVDYEKDTVNTSDGYFTYYIQVFSRGDGIYVVSGRYQWLISPANRKTDVFSVNVGDGLKVLSGSAANLNYVYKADIVVTTGYTTDSYTYENTSTDNLVRAEHYIAASQKLEATVTSSASASVTANNHRGYIQYRAQYSDTSVTLLSAQANYFHQQSAVEFTPSISLNGMSVSVTPKTAFKSMLPNPYLTFSV